MKDELRASQLIRPFGPGAMVELPDRSIIISGLDDWRYPPGRRPVIDEPRLLARLRQLLDNRDLLLRPPPLALSEQGGNDRPGVPGRRFPGWFVASGPVRTNGNRTRRPLVSLDSIRDNKMRHRGSDGQNYSVTAIRFVQACRRGHVADINWKWFVHNHENCHRQLWLEERGTSGDLRDNWIVCDCGAERSMTEATTRSADDTPGALGLCRGERPWLGDVQPGGCSLKAELLIRTASNAWFGQTLSVISVPETDDDVLVVVRQFWEDQFIAVEELVDLQRVRERIPKVRAALGDWSDEMVMAAIARHRKELGELGDGRESVKTAEYEALAAAPLATAEVPPPPLDPAAQFEARALPRDPGWPGWMDPIEQVVLVHRLRQVTALLGFSRLQAAGTELSGEPEEGAQRAPLARHQDWLPAIENRGEGIFVQFRADAIEAWARRPAVRDRAAQHQEGYQAWRKARGIAGERPAPPIAWYLIHSISHLLMAAIALDSGYPSSALAERIYAEEGQYGILILTAAAGSAGTLGGLVETGRRLDQHLARALEMGAICSNDPVCSAHDPVDVQHQLLVGAACHGCLMAPETSCEQFNNYLDRALVIPALGQPDDLALFPRL